MEQARPNPNKISPAQNEKLKHLGIFAFLVLALISAFITLGMGRYNLSLAQIVDNIMKTINGVEIDKNVGNIIFNIRLPRIILALCAGAGLSVAGASFQSLFGNPLATPDTLGVAAGASFGAVLAIFFEKSIIEVQIYATLFGLLAILLVGLISRVNENRSLIVIVLSGIIISALFQALVSGVKFVADTQDTLPSITFWLLGGLNAVNTKMLIIGLPLILIGIAILYLLRWRLNILSLHEDEIKTLGVNIKFTRGLVIIASTMITAAVISLCGTVGWLGLIVPHMARMLFGNNNRFVIPASITMGAFLFLIIDTIARTASAAEIPISILTAIIGAPFFIVLLRHTGGFGR